MVANNDVWRVESRGIGNLVTELCARQPMVEHDESRNKLYDAMQILPFLGRHFADFHI